MAQNLQQKLISDRAFYVTITDADTGSRSIHYLIDHMLVKFEQNRMVRNTQNFALFGKEGQPILRKC